MTKEFYPLVSIVIPVFNGANYMKVAIDSALNQTYKNIEVIVVDDGSTDNTKEIALSYREKIKYFKKPNGGVATALNLGVHKMEGEYFSWLSHDDIYYPSKIERQVKLVEELGKHCIIYSDFDLINESGEVFAISNLPKRDPQFFRYWLTYESRLHGCSLLIPKQAFTKIGLFDDALLTTQDYDLWFKFSYSYSFIHCPEVLISSRQHSNQATNSMPYKVISECNNLHYKFLSRLENSDLPLPIVKSLYELAKSFYKRKFFLASASSFKLIIGMKPSIKYLIFSFSYFIRSIIMKNLHYTKYNKVS